MSATGPVIEITNMSFSYGSGLVLDSANLQLEQGDFCGMIGPNGGGKTTLIRLCLGVIEPVEGTVRLLGGDPKKTRQRAGYIPQEVSTNMSFPISVIEVVLMGLAHKRGLFKRFTRQDRDMAYAILHEFNLHELANRQIGELSGGQRQKVLLARALVAQPEILFLDEPTASIDASGQNEIYDYLKKINDHGTTILVTTHNVGAISTYIKSIACVNRYLHFHADGKMDEELLKNTFGCPVDIIAHGLPHRVLQKH